MARSRRWTLAFKHTRKFFDTIDYFLGKSEASRRMQWPSIDGAAANKSIQRLLSSKMLKTLAKRMLHCMVGRPLWTPISHSDLEVFLNTFLHSLVHHTADASLETRGLNRTLTDMALENNHALKDVIEALLGGLDRRVATVLAFGNQRHLHVKERIPPTEWIRFLAMYRSSARAYRMRTDSTARFSFFHTHRAVMAASLDNPQRRASKQRDADEMKAFIRRTKGSAFVARLELEWQREVRTEFMPVLHYRDTKHARTFLPEDNFNVGNLSDHLSENHQLLHELVLDPHHMTLELNGRLFRASPFYRLLTERMDVCMWAQIGFECAQPHCPCYLKVLDGFKLILGNMGIMIDQQDRANIRLESVLDLKAMEAAVAAFRFHPVTDTRPILEALVGIVAAFHDPELNVPRRGARRFVPTKDPVGFGPLVSHRLHTGITERGTTPQNLHQQMQCLYDVINDVIIRDRRCTYEQMADAILQPGPMVALRVLQQKLDESMTTLEHTRAWLERKIRWWPQGEEGDYNREYFPAIYASAVVTLLKNTPALLLIWPETLVQDKRRFLELYNEFQELVDMRISLQMLNENPHPNDFGTIYQRIKNNQQRSSPMRLMLVQRFKGFLEAQLEVS